MTSFPGRREQPWRGFRRLLTPAVMLGLVAILFRVELLAGLAGGFLVGAWLVWSVPRLDVRGVHVERSHPQRVFFGESVEVKIELSARGPWPLPWVAVTDPVPFDLGASSSRWVTSLMPGETRTFTRTLNANRRGYHMLGPTVVSSGDVFGLRRSQGRPIPASGLLVYPRIVPLTAAQLELASPFAAVRRPHALAEDPNRLIGVREYLPGNPIRRVHWTASAAHGALLVKQFERGVSQQVIVAVDLIAASHPHPGRHRSAELSVTVAASLLHHLITLGHQPAGFRLRATDAPTGRRLVVDQPPAADEAHLAECLEHLARARIDRDHPPDPALASARGLGFGVGFVLVTGRLDQAVAHGLVRLRRVGARPLVVITSSTVTGWEPLVGREGVSVRRVASLREVGTL